MAISGAVADILQLLGNLLGHELQCAEECGAEGQKNNFVPRLQQQVVELILVLPDLHTLWYVRRM